MTKEEFIGFSSAAQHDMVLEALVRITKNLGTIEKESGKPFVGTVKQRRNDIKLLTILAEAFCKNELVWKNSESTRDEVKMIPRDEVLSRFSEYTGFSQNPWDPTPMIEKTIDNGKGSRNVFSEMMDAKEKIESAQKRSGHFMSFENNKES